MTTDPPVPPGVDPSTRSPARLYDCYLGGTANCASDRMVAERMRELIPEPRGFPADTSTAILIQAGLRDPSGVLEHPSPRIYARSSPNTYPRTRAEVERFFANGARCPLAWEQRTESERWPS